MPDIHISGLTKQFGDTKVLKGLDLTVKEGEFLTLLGSSGCGKSTLLKLIAGLDQPDAGSIRLGQRDLLALSPSQRDCAMVFQSYALYPHMTVGGNICTPLLMRGLNFWGRLPGAKFFSANTRRVKAEAQANARKVAQSLGIDGLWERKPAQLSGGQRQRVALARAMVRHPAVFLFDEPLSNLDANLRQALRTEIRQLHDQLGVTFIYVTHDQHEAMSMSDRVAVMREGLILQIGTPEEIYTQPANLDVARFVGAPRINLLDAEVRAHGAVWAQGRQVGHSHGRSGTCHVAFRPQAGCLESRDGMQVQGVVVSVEYTGAEQIASLQVDGTEETSVFCLPANSHGIRVGQTLRVSVPLGEIHLFDADGQRRAFEPFSVLMGEAA
ncbi:MAG: ABC transporter ATP-binding protein [Rhodoferax sp.]|uniref:ABC transporter ATP-binding protein n=1 Tax=Rhodoferax sp. TaxID=50421 RepID=UPI00271F0B0B|nr:ABC transporter ATP-binding protein [Rhodoferax sp.]MDO8447833.1 ABC transporter ATP-binding protein [Rhodoferax sp.]